MPSMHRFRKLPWAMHRSVVEENEGKSASRYVSQLEEYDRVCSDLRSEYDYCGQFGYPISV